MNCSIRCPIRTQDSPLRWLKSNSGASTVTRSRISPTRTYKRQPFQRLKEMSRCFWSPPTPMRSTGPITLLWYTPIMSWNHASLMRPSQPFRHPGDPICFLHDTPVLAQLPRPSLAHLHFPFSLCIPADDLTPSLFTTLFCSIVVWVLSRSLPVFSHSFADRFCTTLIQPK